MTKTETPMSVIELQKFLLDELEEASPTSTFSRAFQPLTDGLGLESPKTPPPKQPATPKKNSLLDALVSDAPKKEIIEPVAPRTAQAPLTPLDLLSEEEREKKNAAKMLLAQNEIENETIFSEEKLPESSTDLAEDVVTPPPVPKPSISRRIMAGLLDHLFVDTLLVLTLYITAQFSARMANLSIFKILEAMSRPPFPYYAALEYLTLWFCYYFIGMGLLDNTFGMWVWGIKLSPGEKIPFGKRVMRVIVSLFFVPSLLPTVVLVFRKGGRNLVDFFSGTSLYLCSN